MRIHKHAALEAYSPSDEAHLLHYVSAEGVSSHSFYMTKKYNKNTSYRVVTGNTCIRTCSVLPQSPLTRILSHTCRQFVSQKARNKRSGITDTWAAKVGALGWLSLEKLRPSDVILLHRCVRHKQTNRSSSGLISGLSFMSPVAEQVFLGPQLALWVDESHRDVLNKHVFWPEEMWFEAITSRLASTWH